MWRTKDSACLKAETLAMVGRGDVSAASTVGLRNKPGRPGGPQVQPGWGGLHGISAGARESGA